MLPGQVHPLVDFLDSVHVRPGIVGKLDFLPAADMFCPPVEIPQIYWHPGLLGNCVESGLPSLHRLACAFGSDGQVEPVCIVHLMDDTEHEARRILPVHRESAEFSEQPSERSHEEVLS